LPVSNRAFVSASPGSLRFHGLKEPRTGLAAVEEVIAAAASTGAPLHVVHITSMGMQDTPRLIEMV